MKKLFSAFTPQQYVMTALVAVTVNFGLCFIVYLVLLFDGS
jgi:hypothetical protein